MCAYIPHLQFPDQVYHPHPQGQFQFSWFWVIPKHVVNFNLPQTDEHGAFPYPNLFDSLQVWGNPSCPWLNGLWKHNLPSGHALPPLCPSQFPTICIPAMEEEEGQACYFCGLSRLGYTYLTSHPGKSPSMHWPGFMISPTLPDLLHMPVVSHCCCYCLPSAPCIYCPSHFGGSQCVVWFPVDSQPRQPSPCLCRHLPDPTGQVGWRGLPTRNWCQTPSQTSTLRGAPTSPCPRWVGTPFYQTPPSFYASPPHPFPHITVQFDSCHHHPRPVARWWRWWGGGGGSGRQTLNRLVWWCSCVQEGIPCS